MTVLIIIFGFAMLILMLSVLSISMIPGGTGTGANTGYILGFGAIALAVVVTVVRLQPSAGVPLSRFQPQVLVCLALAELGTLLGFVWHNLAGTQVWPIGLGSEAVILLVILPRVLAYFRMNA